MNRIFHIALHSPFYNSTAITNAFVGKTVLQFNWQAEKYNHGRDQMRSMALSQAKDFNADLIFLHCQITPSFDLETIKALQAIAPVVNFTFDVKKDISWYKEVAPHISLTLFACDEDVDDCRNSGIFNVAYLPSSADFNFYRPLQLLNNDAIKHYDIVFIGNDTIGSNLEYPLAQQRREMVSFMNEKFPKKFMAYGLGQAGGMVMPEEEREIYNKCKIAITHNHFRRAGYCSDRDWRAVGCGPLVIHHSFKGVHALFGRSIATWSEKEDIEFCCEHFLKNPFERLRLAEMERDQVVLYHSWVNRINQMLKILETQKQPA